MKPHQPTIDIISKCANNRPGQLLARALVYDMDLSFADAILMCDRNGLEPFQICGTEPLKQLANVDTTEINLLRQEIRANSIDIVSQLSIIRGIILRLDALESKLNHHNP